ncbi:hypothetical protein WAK64_02390 [Bacillus spongiae]|uniref:Transcriptional regulator n=1 Tax=Bacillus spongiae TaxID=2683610 RepID=A0ABU8H9I3_9BACI
MAKRKAEHNAALKNNTTPKTNLRETEFSAEFSYGEDRAKSANRNSQKGHHEK